MFKLLDGSKASIIDYFYLMTMILIAAGASLFVRKYGDIVQPVTWIALLFSLLVGIKHHVSLASKPLIITLIVFFIYFTLASFFNGYLNIGFLIYWFVTIFITFIISQSFGKQFFAFFETIVFHLSIISLLFWIACLLAPDDAKELLLQFRFSESFTEDVDAINVIFYTYLDKNYNYDLDTFHTFLRNSGFGFEPGAFASFICVAIACNIARHKTIKLFNNVPLYIFIINLFSTESTTAGVIFIILIVSFFLISNKGKYRFIWFILLVPVIIYVFRFDFVGEKLQDELVNSAGRLQSDSGGASRIMSFRFLFIEFLNHPIFGLAGDPRTWYSSMGYEGALHSGIGHLLSDFGIVMTSLIIFAQIRTIIVFNTQNDRLAALTVIALIGSMVSFSLWKHPVFFFFIIYGLFPKIMISEKLIK